MWTHDRPARSIGHGPVLLLLEHFELNSIISNHQRYRQPTGLSIVLYETASPRSQLISPQRPGTRITGSSGSLRSIQLLPSAVPTFAQDRDRPATAYVQQQLLLFKISSNMNFNIGQAPGSTSSEAWGPAADRSTADIRRRQARHELQRPNPCYYGLVSRSASLTEFGEYRALILTQVTVRWGSEAPASAGDDDTFKFSSRSSYFETAQRRV